MTKIQELRKQKKLSQSQLAELSGISFRTLQDYEQGRKDIKKAQAGTVLKISKALSCSMEELIES